jgi:hypothetical protein
VAGGLLLVKLVGTPAIIAFVSWVERRFGPSLAGLVFGFPLTSSLASVFLAAEQGPGFAREATVGLLVGIATLAAYCVAFAHAAVRRAPWPLALAIGLGAYVPSAYLGSFLGGIGRAWAALLALLALAAAATLLPRRLGPAPPRPHGRWELPLRMAIATALVVVLTALAEQVGPQLTGLLLMIPASTSTLSSFVLGRAGPSAAVTMLRGLVWGCFSFVAFYVVAGAALGTMATGLAFALSALAALGCSGMTWRLAVSRHGVVATDDAVD